MPTLLAGLLLFFASHSVRILAAPWRARQIARLGEMRWKGLHALVSLLGLGLIVHGFGLAREAPLTLWSPPHGMAHPAALLTLPAFVLLIAAYLPGNRIKAAVGHPMVLGVALWALAHLLANGQLHEVLLFGAFLLWALVDFAVARRREPPPGGSARQGAPGRDIATLLVGLVAWWGFAFHLHGWLFGVSPFG